jgi:hypothetical protein
MMMAIHDVRFSRMNRCLSMMKEVGEVNSKHHSIEKKMKRWMQSQRSIEEVEEYMLRRWRLCVQTPDEM